MKLLQLIRSLDPTGGGPMEGVRQITPHLAALGVSTTVASLDPADAPWLQSQPFEVHGLGTEPNGYGFSPGLPARIRALSFEHDVVIVHGIWQYHSYATWRALRGTAIPYFVYTHGMLDPWFRRNYPLKHLKKWAYWPWADYRVLRDAKAVLFTTEQERLLARDSFWLYEAKELVVGFGTSMPPGDPEKQRELFLALFPQLRGQRILLFLSRIHPKKGVDILIESFAAVASNNPRLQLVIAGPDQVGWQAELQKRAAALGIAHRIIWPGMLIGDLKWGAFHSAELFCLPSHQENFGIVVAEALACGLPVAIAAPVNISAEVKASGAGLVHPDTVPGTVHALQQWLALTAVQKEQMGQRGRQLFLNSFNFSSVAKNLLTLLESSSSAP